VIYEDLDYFLHIGDRFTQVNESYCNLYIHPVKYISNCYETEAL